MENKYNAYVNALKLISPIASQTETTIALLWNKPDNASEIMSYQIHVGEDIQTVNKTTDYTITNLLPDSEYEIFICSILKNGETLDKSNVIKVKTKPKSEIYDITAFGAIGDGKTKNTMYIQAAVDKCCHGGTVYVPKGVYLTGAIFIKDNMTLYLEEGAVLLGSTDTDDYPLINYRFEGLETVCYASLINTIETDSDKKLRNITIAGKGKIDANGSILRQKEITELKGKPGRAICLRNAENVYITEITVKQSPAWCLHLIYCNQITINNISIYTKFDENGDRYKDICNGDGLTLDSSTNAYVFHSMIASQDDCISIKSGRDGEGRKVGIPTENIYISNCIFKSGFGIAVGSEMSGDVRNVFVEDCIYEDVYSVASIKAPRGRGGVIENIRCHDLTLTNKSLEHKDCEWFRGALYIDQFYSHKTFDTTLKEDFNEGTSIIRDIYFENITLDTHAGNAIYLTGLPESPLKNIHLKNIKATGKYGLKANNIVGLKLEKVTIISREDEDFIMKGVSLC